MIFISNKSMNRVALPVVLFLHLFLLINLRFTAWPEMFSYPYLVDNGYKLYTDIVYPYPPLLTYILTNWYRIFGYSLFSLQSLTWIFIFISDVFIFKIIELLTKNRQKAVVGLVFFVLFQPFLEGNMLWFDSAVVPFLLGGVYMYLLYQGGQSTLSKEKILIISGFFFTLAVFIKQTVALFPALIFILLVAKRQKLKTLLAFIVAPLSIGSIFIFTLAVRGAFSDFLSWALVYPSSFWTKFPGYVQMTIPDNQRVVLSLLLAPLLLYMVGYKKDKNNFLIIPSCVTLGLIAIYPRFSYFHFQSALAFLAIIVGIVFSAKRKTLWLVYGLILFYLSALPVYRIDWQKEARFWSKDELQLAKIMRAEIQSEEKILLIGLPSQLYVMSDTLPPKPWADIYGWYLEIPNIQNDIIARWSKDLPTIILEQRPKDGNWFDLATYRPSRIMEWVEVNYTQTTMEGDVIKWTRNR